MVCQLRKTSSTDWLFCPLLTSVIIFRHSLCRAYGTSKSQELPTAVLGSTISCMLSLPNHVSKRALEYYGAACQISHMTGYSTFYVEKKTSLAHLLRMETDVEPRADYSAGLLAEAVKDFTICSYVVVIRNNLKQYLYGILKNIPLCS